VFSSNKKKTKANYIYFKILTAFSIILGSHGGAMAGEECSVSK
jgi:hypothetical protein